MRKTILLAGGSGLIGSRLSTILRDQQYHVRLLTRTPKHEHEFKWDPVKGEIDKSALKDVDYVVNLAGAGIADKRWTAERKREIVESRVQAAQVLANAFSEMEQKPEVYVSASAIGIYGNSGEKIMSENDPPVDHSFMVECCRQWESAADHVAELGIRTVKLRFGIVLAKEGGALAEVAKPLRFGLGTYFGDGHAWWSWIHLDDVCRMILWSIENPQAEGAYNAVAPKPVRGIELVHATAEAMNKKALFVPVPAFALKLALGEMSAVVLNSNHVSDKKVSTAGFKFLYPELHEALNAIF